MAGFLTQSQFNQWKTTNKKPLATYQGYKTWVTKARTARAAKQASAGGAMGSFTGALSPAVHTQLQGDIDTQIKASLGGIRAATAADQAQSNRQAEVAQKYAVALGNITAPDAAQIKDSYLNAADRYKALGQGLTGAVSDAQGRDVDAVRQNIQQQTGAAPTVTGTYDLNDLRNTALMTGVTIPGQELVSDALRAGTLAAYDRQAQVSQVGQVAQEYLQKSTDAQGQLAAKRAELEATRPMLWQKAVADYQKSVSDAEESKRQDRALQVQVGTLELANAKTAWEQATARSKITDTLWLVDKKGHVYDTGRATTGTPGAIAAADQAAQTERAEGNRKTQVELANIRKAASKYSADTSAQAQKDTANIAARARKAAAAIAAQIASGKKGGATPKQKADIVRNAGVTGGKQVEKRRNVIASHIRDLDPRDTNEKMADYQARRQRGMTRYRNRLLEHRQSILNDVVGIITPQLQVLGMDANKITQYADWIVEGDIPKDASKIKDPLTGKVG